MRADITETHAYAQGLLEVLGGKGTAIPFLVVFPSDKPNEPRVLTDFNVFNPGEYRSRLFQILDETETAVANDRQTASRD